MKKPDIVFVINYFYPDMASTGQLLTELCLHLQHDFNITVIAAQPGYAGEEHTDKRRVEYDQLEHIRIIRIRLPMVNKRSKISRLRYIATYFFYANLLVFKQKKFDIIYTISQPPILGGLIGTIGKRLKKSKHIYNIQDFNPEQAEAVGFMKNKWIVKAARWLDTINCRYADHIITVGHDMQETLIRRFADRNVTENSVINNWTNEEEITPLTKEHPQVSDFIIRNGWENKFIVMYSGNLGLFYDLENLIKITAEFKEYRDLSFVFIGEGAVKKQMKAYVEEHDLTNVHFLPYQPKDDLKYSLNAADVHLVVNQKGIKGVSVPSKIYGVMAAGKPILGVLEEGSEAYRLIVESQCGLVAEPQDYREIIKQLKKLYNRNGMELMNCGLQGRKYLDQHLRRNISLEKYRELLISI
ncbi:glycosyltransferase family 4 protein [Paenibacillus spongiae]|uniref:Glycosyltransferase family 4 protein n=1 Tax=Paenibacillus spongiae TaxID=2909671 RepID=A0ABY5SDJ2_9BACL|nr:glycosyltransferase family 4 protein [Paenibacillus spongiae]UVI31613.1 glycosyltransferase family 4 protein [Paenibacillus spongiae]